MNTKLARRFPKLAHPGLTAEDIAIAVVIVPMMVLPWLAILAVMVGADLPNV
jgi:hypothetical protein